MKDEQLTGQQLLEAYAASIGAYYKAESAFTRDPSPRTHGAYHRAVDRLTLLRRETSRAFQLADALHAEEIEEQSELAETLLARAQWLESKAPEDPEPEPEDPTGTPPVEPQDPMLEPEDPTAASPAEDPQ